MATDERLTVAIIDDNADNRFLMRTYLEDRYNVVEFSNGLDALAGLNDSRPELIFLDISLPHMDGVEILRRIRADESLRDLRVVALTAHAMMGDEKRFLDLGFDHYLSKPILDLNKMCDLIENIKDRKPARIRSAHSF